MERPSFQFYADAWLSDIGLRACSSAARGLLADLMCYMHQGSPYGYLRIPNEAGEFFVPTEDDIARMTGNAKRDVVRWIRELRQKNALKEDENGVLFSKKLVKIECTRSQWKERKKKARKPDKLNADNNGDRGVTQMSRGTLAGQGGEKQRVVPPMSRPSPSPSPSPEDQKKDPPSGELVLTHETPTVEAPPSPNPARFIAYWQDANEHRDFALRLQPEASFREFLANEAVRLEWSRDGPDFERFVAGSLERFKACYSKRGGKKRATRGKSLKPQQLTEELVAWIRSDLAEQQKRDAVRFKSQAERVDESVARLAKGDNAEQWRTEDEIEPGTPSGALSGLLRDR